MNIFEIDKAMLLKLLNHEDFFVRMAHLEVTQTQPVNIDGEFKAEYFQATPTM